MEVLSARKVMLRHLRSFITKPCIECLHFYNALCKPLTVPGNLNTLEGVDWALLLGSTTAWLEILHEVAYLQIEDLHQNLNLRIMPVYSIPMISYQ